MVKYSYDAWGNCKVLNASGAEITAANHIGNLNPFRYRGYYYDTETKLYYLQSRYYDPEIGRFIRIDDIIYLDPDAINGLNLYAYCLNNPVMYCDYNGYSLLAIGIILATTALIGGTVGGVVAYNNGFRGWDLVKSIALGATIGLAVGGAIVATAAVMVGASAFLAGATAATVFGVPVLQAFAIGALAFDFFAYFVAPLFGKEVSGIEYEQMPPNYIPSNNSGSSHPAFK